jgi:hypothetical protein
MRLQIRSLFTFMFFLITSIFTLQMSTVAYAESSWIVHMRTASKIEKLKVFRILNKEIKNRLKQLNNNDQVVLDSLSTLVTNSSMIDSCDFTCLSSLAKKANVDGFIYAYPLHKSMGDSWLFEMFNAQGELIDQSEWKSNQKFIFKSPNSTHVKKNKVNYKGLYFIDNLPGTKILVNDKVQKVQKLRKHSKWSVDWIPLKYGTYTVTLQKGKMSFKTKVTLNSKKRTFIFHGWKGSNQKTISPCKKEICEGQVLIQSESKQGSVVIEGQDEIFLDKSGSTLLTLPVGKYTLGLRTPYMIRFKKIEVKLKQLTKLNSNQMFKETGNLSIKRKHPSVKFKIYKSNISFQSGSTWKMPKGVVRVKIMSKGCPTEYKYAWLIEDELSLTVGQAPCVTEKKIKLACPLVGAQLFLDSQLQKTSWVNLDLDPDLLYDSKCVFEGLAVKRKINGMFKGVEQKGIQLQFMGRDLLRIQKNKSRMRSILRMSSLGLWVGSALSAAGGFLSFLSMQDSLDKRDSAFNSWNEEQDRTKLAGWSSQFNSFDQEAKSASSRTTLLISLGVTLAISGVVTWLLMPEEIEIKSTFKTSSVVEPSRERFISVKSGEKDTVKAGEKDAEKAGEKDAVKAGEKDD